MFVLAAPTASLFDTTVTFEKHGGKKLLVVHDRYPVAGSARQRVAKQAVEWAHANRRASVIGSEPVKLRVGRRLQSTELVERCTREASNAVRSVLSAPPAGESSKP
jgi:hypothetical protein